MQEQHGTAYWRADKPGAPPQQQQGGITLPPQPTNQNCMDAVLIWKWNY
jgi:hypothetical protein